MLEKSRNAVFFQWFVCRVSPKVGLLKRRVRRSGGQRRNHKLHAAVAKSTFWSENAKKLTVSEHFLKFRCQKIAHRCGEKLIMKSKCSKTDGVGALFEVHMSKNCTPLWRKTHFEVKMLTKLTVSEHFLKFRCRKIACRCGEKHIWKWKCTKHSSFGALFEVLMRQNCTPLWRKRTFWSQNVQNTSVSEHFLKFWCRKISWVES